MKIRVVPEARSLQAKRVRGNIAVVIDTLRATTSIAYAVAGGATVEPVGSVAEARRRKKKGVLIAGERGGKPLSGFDLGNSPVEMKRAALQGMRLVLTTTNGTGAVARSAGAAAIFSGAIVNATAIAKAIAPLCKGEMEVVMVCAGRTTGLALEDLLGAGAIIHALTPDADPRAMTDGARASLELFLRERGRLPAFLLECESGRNLARLGATEDLAFCAMVDALDVAPRLLRGRFVR